MFFCLCLWSLFGVFGCVSVSVTEGDCVTLFVNLTESQMKKGISWKFGAEESLIADNKSGHITISDDKPDKRFKDKLKLNKHTGDLTITNTSITHTGLYQMTNIKTDQRLTTVTLTVYARLPLPVISRVSSLSGSFNCSVLCSLMNVSHVSLSWYKGKSLLSSISVSEHSNINISLHLECLDDSYTCVVNNPITNQTQHLNTDDCHKCSEPSLSFSRSVPLSCAVVISLMCVAALLIVYIYRKHRQRDQHDHTSEQEITYAEPTFCNRQTNTTISAVEDDMVYAGVMTR
ncbi:CD48 antigen-like [Triplophysa dalaica]|uniref:CD48 antigen-like n=1 Tax=Triplophysa dalaica TaxID=1582913 RepID=UPI0024DFB8CD|nr:CD48 antigen-like [Triplophysa dalaica]